MNPDKKPKISPENSHKTLVIEQTEPSIVSTKRQPVPRTVLLFVILLVVMGASLLVNQLRPAGSCSKAVITAADTAINTGNVTAMGESAKTAKTVRHYDHDPNCLYIVSYYDISNRNLGQAQKDIDQLKALQGGKPKFDTALAAGKASIQTLTDLLAAYKASPNGVTTTFEGQP